MNYPEDYINNLDVCLQSDIISSCVNEEQEKQNMFVKNVGNLSSIGHIRPIEENIVRLNAEIKAMQEECLKQTSVVVSQKTAYVVERSSAILNLRLLTESAVQIRAAMNCIVKKSLEKIILNGLEAQRDIGVAIGE